MKNKKLLILILIFLLVPTTLNKVNAQPISSISFHGVGIDVELKYPQDAHPEDHIYHNITITSTTNPNLKIFNLTIYQEIDQIFYEITNLALFNWGTLTDPLTRLINITIPQETDGRLYCTLHIKTDQSSDYYFATIYSTQVKEITYDELRADYDQLFSEYQNNLASLTVLQNQINSLDRLNDELETDLNQKIIQYNSLSSQFENQKNTLNSTQTDYSNLQTHFNELNQTNISLQNDIESLQSQLETAYADVISKDQNLATDRILMTLFIVILVVLIAIIVYIRNKQKEPYVVIRKETVSMKPSKK